MEFCWVFGNGGELKSSLEIEYFWKFWVSASLCTITLFLQKKSMKPRKHGSDKTESGVVRELNPGPLAPEARIFPLDQRPAPVRAFTNCIF